MATADMTAKKGGIESFWHPFETHFRDIEGYGKQYI